MVVPAGKLPKPTKAILFPIVGITEDRTLVSELLLFVAVQVAPIIINADCPVRVELADIRIELPLTETTVVAAGIPLP